MPPTSILVPVPGMKAMANGSIHIRFTLRFGVLESNNDPPVGDTAERENVQTGSIADQKYSVIPLYDLLVAHGSIRRQQSLQNNNRTTLDSEAFVTEISSINIRKQLYDGLVHHGFVLILVPKGRAANVIQDMRTSLCVDLFPVDTVLKDLNIPAACSKHLETSPHTYVSERGVPMYKLGYESCEDGVREVFRVAAGEPDTVVWPSSSRSTTSDIHQVDQNNNVCTKTVWMRGLGLLRHVTDAALDLLLQFRVDGSMDSSKTKELRQKRPFSGAATWCRDDRNLSRILPNRVRSGDFSVLYAMHYFNSENVSPVEPGVAVKAHVDPSLLVIEPFMCTTTTGLQVCDRSSKENAVWMDCDGPNSPLHTLVQDAMDRDEEVMLLFAGKALSAAIPYIEPTLHRVVMGNHPRRTIIYEQKYAEFYPPASFD